ncbi:purine-binding chemotaxis protein CheW [Ectothiorhodospiraceae bacterium BW-2]|nr:purine-binding chemotaxis protein CheW [Ectothiorhodospiraceae bacterium BW-2]
MTELATLNSRNERQSASHPGEAEQYLTFVTGGETFAIAILDVKEIIEIEQMTRVPMTPNFIRGVINLRGNVVPVIDLSSRLGRQVSEITKKSCIVLVEMSHEAETQTIGMMVDEVNEILEIDESHTQPPPNFGTDIRTEFIRAMGRVGEEFIILLNVEHVLSVEDISEISRLGSVDPKLLQKKAEEDFESQQENDT